MLSVIFQTFLCGIFECALGWIDEDGNEIDDDVPSQDDDDEDDFLG